MNCRICHDTGIINTSFGSENVQAFCDCKIGKQKALDREANLPKRYITSLDSLEFGRYDKFDKTGKPINSKFNPGDALNHIL
jgi:hypothetical protein